MAASKRRLLVGVTTGALLFAGAGYNWAQNELALSFHGFQDSRAVTVLSPEVEFNRDFTDRTSVKAKFGVDAISAASDSCARCHPGGTTNRRGDLNLSVVRKYGDTKVTVGGEISRELFYRATTALTSVSRDLNNANTTVAAGFSYSLNEPMLHPDTTFEKQHSFDGFASLTQSWTKRTVTQVGYELNQINGFQSNPFLRAVLDGDYLVGNTPTARTRHAVTARLRHALPAETFLEADYRYYRDNWSITSNAGSVGLSHHFGDRIVGGASFRRYTQSGAFFYAPTYTGNPEFMTADFRLFPFNSNMVTGHVAVMPKNGVFNLRPGTSLELQYERYSSTIGFQAAVFSGGVRIPLK